MNKLKTDTHLLQTTVTGSSGLFISNEDNMLLMSRYPDNYFDLAIVDPPYGIGNFGNRIKGNEKLNKWDVAPKEDYFTELKRVSKNQIIWGGNYFPYLWNSPKKSFIIWNKDNPVINFSSVELAVTSFDTLPKYYYYAWGGLSDGIKGKNKKEKSIHPTQKPNQLYKFILENYAKEGDKILDTHLGSGSIALACYDYKYELTACELDTEYYNKAMERIKNHVAQQKLF